MRNKILSLLVLLLTAVTGAWAEGTVTVTEIKASEMPTSWENNNNPVKATDLPGFTAVTRDEAKALGAPAAEGDIFVFYAIYNNTFMGLHWNDGVFDDTDGEFSLGAIYALQDVFKFYYVAAPAPPLTVEWNASTKTGTFSMPGSDVVLTPQYAPAAQLAENGAPAAVSGLEIAADAAIITAGQSAQGTLLYAVGTSQTEKPALTAFAATLPNAKDQTAAGNYYVWYYIQGHDTPQGEEPSADNTFNDSEIMGPLTVELLTNEHTLNIKQSPNITVTVAGTAKTPTDDKVTPVTTGQEVKIKAKEGYKFRKVEVKKAEAAVTATITVAKGYTDLSGDKLLYYTPGETYRQAIANHPENKLDGGLGWNIWENGSDATIFYKESADKSRDLSIDGDQHFRPTDSINLDTVIDPTLNFYFVAQF